MSLNLTYVTHTTLTSRAHTFHTLSRTLIRVTHIHTHSRADTHTLTDVTRAHEQSYTLIHSYTHAQGKHFYARSLTLSESSQTLTHSHTLSQTHFHTLMNTHHTSHTLIHTSAHVTHIRTHTHHTQKCHARTSHNHTISHIPHATWITQRTLSST